MKFVWYNHKTKYTEGCPIPNDGGSGIVYVCEKRVKDFEQQSRVYNAVFSHGPWRPRYNGVAVYISNLPVMHDKWLNLRHIMAFVICPIL